MSVLPSRKSTRWTRNIPGVLRLVFLLVVVALLAVPLGQVPVRADAPVADDQAVTTDEDTALDITLTATDADGDALRFRITSPPTDGSLSGTPPDVTYSPGANYHGSDSFQFVANDGTSDSDEATVSITINPINDAPTLLPLSEQTLDEDASLDNAIDLWAYAADPETSDSGLRFAIDNTPDPNAGVSIDGNQYIDIQPAADWHGVTDVEIRVTDPEGLFVMDTLRVTVRSVNDAPWIDPVVPNRFANEDTPIVLDLSTYEKDIESSDTDLDWTVSGQGHFTVTGENSDDDVLTFTPDADYYGSDTVPLTLTDADGGTATQSIILAWTPVNDRPTLDLPPQITLDEDASLDDAIDLWAYAADPETADSALRFAIDNTPDLNAGVSLDSNQYIDIQPAANWYGATDVQIRVTDPEGLFVMDTLRVIVNSINDAPQATEDSFAVVEDTTDNPLDVLDNDDDIEGDNLTISDAGPAQRGVVVVTADRTALLYTPTPDAYGQDTFTYTVQDGNGGSGTATVTIQVGNVNDNPDARDDSDAINEDSGANDIPVLDNDTYLPDPVETLRIVDASQGAHGTVTITGHGAGLTYDPDPDYFGGDSFTYVIEDGNGGSDTATVQVTVHNVNDDPQTNTDSAGVDEDSISNWIDVLSNDTYLPDAFEVLRITDATDGSHGSVTVQDDGQRLAYTPDEDFYGRDSFTYLVSDGHGGSATGTVNVTVSNINDDPLAGNDTETIEEDSDATQIDVLPNDTFLPDPPETLTIVGYTNAQHGTVNIVESGNRLAYRPDPNFAGTDAFAYTISDGHGGYDTARVDVTVTGINDRPIAEDDSAATDEDTPVTIDVLSNDIDIDGLLVRSSVQVTDDPDYGSTSVNASNGQITYTPDPNWNGHDHFIYRVCDSGLPLPAQCSTARVDIAVGAVNDLPVSGAGSDQTVDTLTTVTLDGSSSYDPDGHLPLTYLWSQVGGPYVTLGTTGVVSPTFAAPDDPTVLTFTLRVVDALGQADLVPDEVVVTVTNRPPIADAGPDQKVLVGTRVTLDGSKSDDPDNDLPLTYTWTQSGGPSVELDDASASSPTFVAPDEPAVLTFSLFISDAFGEPAHHVDEVMVTVGEPYLAYMPLIFNKHAIAPDLVVQSITVTGNDVRLVIKNVGNAGISHEFWVDAYINPRIAPTGVNQAWWELGDQGIAWWVSGPALAALVPGGSLTLRPYDRYYVAEESEIKTWPLPAGTVLYAQADSYNPNNVYQGRHYGEVFETHEMIGDAYNNIRGPVVSPTAAAAGAASSSEPSEPGPAGTPPPPRR